MSNNLEPLQQLEIGDAGAFSDLSDEELDAFIADTGELLSQAKRQSEAVLGDPKITKH